MFRGLTEDKSSLDYVLNDKLQAKTVINTCYVAIWFQWDIMCQPFKCRSCIYKRHEFRHFSLQSYSCFHFKAFRWSANSNHLFRPDDVTQNCRQDLVTSRSTQSDRLPTVQDGGDYAEHNPKNIFEKEKRLDFYVVYIFLIEYYFLVLYWWWVSISICDSLELNW